MLSSRAEKLVRVVRVSSVRPHPNADRLDILHLDEGLGPFEPLLSLVSGKHYVTGQLGIYIPVGSILPGPLSVDMWLWGAKPDKPWVVEAKMMRGIMSAGLFGGREYRVDPNDPRSVAKHAEMSAAGDTVLEDGALLWARWNEGWALGDDVTEELGIFVMDSVTS